MPICTGCSVRFDETFRFCPQCGTAKPVDTGLGQVEFVICSSCGHHNHPTFKICQKCNLQIVQKCRQCRTKNNQSNITCVHCGTILKDAKFTLTEDEILHWSNIFLKHKELAYCNLKPGGAYYSSAYPQIMKINQIEGTGRNSPVTFGEDKILIAIPVRSSTWCIDEVRFSNQKTFQGAWLIQRNKTCLYDFNSNSRKFFLHDELSSVSYQNDWLTLGYGQQQFYQLHFIIPKPSKDIPWDKVLGLTNLVLHIGSSAETQAIQSLKLELTRNRRREKDQERQRQYIEKVKENDKYINLVKSFFSDLLSKKKQFDS